jgi:hypothetical protein
MSKKLGGGFDESKLENQRIFWITKYACQKYRGTFADLVPTIEGLK